MSTGFKRCGSLNIATCRDRSIYLRRLHILSKQFGNEVWMFINNIPTALYPKFSRLGIQNRMSLYVHTIPKNIITGNSKAFFAIIPRIYVGFCDVFILRIIWQRDISYISLILSLVPSCWSRRSMPTQPTVKQRRFGTGDVGTERWNVGSFQPRASLYERSKDAGSSYACRRCVLFS